jgi:hypothetical protein
VTASLIHFLARSFVQHGISDVISKPHQP